MKKILLILFLGILCVYGCGQSSTNTQNLPVLDASSQEKLVESLQMVSASVPVAQKEKFGAYVDFYTKYQLPSPRSYERIAPQLDGKNYREALTVLREDLVDLKEDLEGSIARLSFAGIPEIAAQPSELTKIEITNLKYNKDTHIKEMDIKNGTNKEISAIQVMAREDFEPGPNKRVVMFLIDFPLLDPGKKVHATEKEDVPLLIETLDKELTNGMPAVAIQAFDKDKMLVLNNEALFEAIDAISKLRFLVDEMDKVLQL